MNRLTPDYFQQDDVVFLARDILGKKIYTSADGNITAGIITETEAYNGRTDRACHAYNQRRTPRTEIMYQDGGHAYVYLCYGIHYLFNITTNVAGKADAILIRAIEPCEGLDLILNRRKMSAVLPRISSGPGNVSSALGINMSFYGEAMTGSKVWLENTNVPIAKKDIVSTTRIGVDYAGKDALLPWRFYLKNNRFVSKR